MLTIAPPETGRDPPQWRPAPGLPGDEGSTHLFSRAFALLCDEHREGALRHGGSATRRCLAPCLFAKLPGWNSFGDGTQSVRGTRPRRFKEFGGTRGSKECVRSGAGGGLGPRSNGRRQLGPSKISTWGKGFQRGHRPWAPHSADTNARRGWGSKRRAGDVCLAARTHLVARSRVEEFARRRSPGGNQIEL